MHFRGDWKLAYMIVLFDDRVLLKPIKPRLNDCGENEREMRLDIWTKKIENMHTENSVMKSVNSRMYN